ncbi:MAG TPA: PqqD family protein [Gaiellaceae bacterium]|nr:PqqD family protein [Gaiellaceae bacterium]
MANAIPVKKLHLRTDGLHWREIDGEIVVLEGRSSTYLSANQSGAVLWQALAEGATREELVDDLVETFEIERKRAAVDVDAFLTELSGKGLLQE